MKDNREFLEGVYEKANILEREKRRKNILYKNYLKYSSVAALIVLIPLLSFREQLFKPHTPLEIDENIPKEIRMFNEGTDSYFMGREDIVLGKIEKTYGDGFMDIVVEETFRGETAKSFKLKIPTRGDTLSEGYKIVLFLYKEDLGSYSLLDESSYFTEVEEDVFQDYLGNIYTIQDIKDKIKERE